LCHDIILVIAFTFSSDNSGCLHIKKTEMSLQILRKHMQKIVGTPAFNKIVDIDNNSILLSLKFIIFL
jgi:hypothetical protein